MKQHSHRFNLVYFSSTWLQNELILFSSLWAIPDYTIHSYSFLIITEKREYCFVLEGG